ncbi:GyrI-like domain-containing protein [Pseudonocardia spirodelae]|uniref:GyrI-like domain-containing protein n=1 Tax=Pseudonocardia spirodelae TaxID=3133431 RepID=A0ABU8T919_9PSEU
MPAKVDLKRELPCYSARRDTPELVDVPDLRYLMIDGHGDPNTAAYADALAALYPVAYAAKFASSRELGRDHVVMPLEGLWWAEDMDAFTRDRDKSRWSWTLMIMVPDWVPGEMLDAAVARVRTTRAPARIGDVRHETLAEGRCVQALHVGPYDDEGPLLERIHTGFVPSHGLRMTGRHHEIYLSDPRRAAPEKLRTILRQPVTDA